MSNLHLCLLLDLSDFVHVCEAPTREDLMSFGCLPHKKFGRAVPGSDNCSAYSSCKSALVDPDFGSSRQGIKGETDPL
jgi:hypothetical protein